MAWPRGKRARPLRTRSKNAKLEGQQSARNSSCDLLPRHETQACNGVGPGLLSLWEPLDGTRPPPNRPCRESISPRPVGLEDCELLVIAPLIYPLLLCLS